MKDKNDETLSNQPEEKRTEIDRRRFLGTAGAVAAGALAGLSGGGAQLFAGEWGPRGNLGGADRRKRTMVRVTIDIFSGRPNPVWILDEPLAREVLRQISAEPGVISPADQDRGVLGFRGLLLDIEGEDQLPWKIRLAGGFSKQESRGLEIAELEVGNGLRVDGVAHTGIVVAGRGDRQRRLEAVERCLDVRIQPVGQPDPAHEGRGHRALGRVGERVQRLLVQRTRLIPATLPLCELGIVDQRFEPAAGGGILRADDGKAVGMGCGEPVGERAHRTAREWGAIVGLLLAGRGRRRRVLITTTKCHQGHVKARGDGHRDR